MNLPFELTGSLELLWRATWQAALLVIVVWTAVTLFRRWLTPRWRTLMWTIPLLRFCLLILPPSSVSVYSLVERPEAPQPAATQIIATPETSQFPTESVTQVSPPTAHTSEIAAIEKPPAAPAPQPAHTTESNNGWNISTAGVLKTVWMIGALAVALHWCFSFVFLRRMLSRCRPLEHGELTSWIERHTYNFDRKRRIRYLVTDENVGPASCGLWRPVVILPRRFLDEFTMEELQTVIRHEFEHIRRWDGVFVLLSRAAGMIHWFNPLVYAVRRRLRREMELAVDASVIRGLEETDKKAYGELLLKLSQRPAGRLGLIEMANSRSEIGRRIDQISAPPRESRFSASFAIGLIALLTVSGLSEAALTQDDPPQDNPPAVTEKQTDAEKQPATSASENEKTTKKKYFVEGTVRDAATQKPVEGAEIRIFAASEPDLNKKVRDGMTDVNGKYRIEVPLGHVRLWNPLLKPGYWLKPEDATAPLITSPEEPVVTHDLIVHRGPVWRVKVNVDLSKLRDPRFQHLSVYDVENDDVRKAWLNGDPVSFDKSPPMSISKLDERRTCRITEPGDSRKLIINALTQQAELIAAPEFDNTRVVSAKRLEDSDVTELIDANGRKATITAATVTLEEGSPLLTFESKALATLSTQQLTGKITDSDGQPLSSVKVGVALGQKGGGSGMGGESVQTDSQGRFTLELPIPSGFQSKLSDFQFKLVLNKDGFAGKDTKYSPLPSDGKPIDVGTVTMRPGYSIPVKVLDDHGNPAAGAVVEPVSSYALRMQAMRTDEDGRVVLGNLPVGRVTVSARHGNLYQNSHLIVSSDAEDNDEVTIRLEKLPTTSQTPQTTEKPQKLPVGTQAPEFLVTEWSDGKERKLSDYRGKVVVLEFWGVWCGGCIAMIPMHQKLADEYEKQGVVFLGIHTADGEMEQIKKLKKLKQWKTPTAIDRGASINAGKTCRAYGVNGFGTLIIIDRDGRIAYRSDVKPKDVANHAEYQAKVAKLAGVPWPPAEDLSQEEEVAMAEKIFTVLLSREIERVMSPKK